MASRITSYGVAGRLWSRIREPRIVSAFYGFWYLILAVVWGRALLNPPMTVENLLGEKGMTLISGVILIGALVGVVTVVFGSYQFERTAMLLVALGLAGYFLITFLLELSGTGNRQPGMTSTVGAIGFTLLRSWWIYDRPYRPDKSLDQG